MNTKADMTHDEYFTARIEMLFDKMIPEKIISAFNHSVDNIKLTIPDITNVAHGWRSNIVL
jgi:hypothetical protein